MILVFFPTTNCSNEVFAKYRLKSKTASMEMFLNILALNGHESIKVFDTCDLTDFVNYFNTESDLSERDYWSICLNLDYNEAKRLFTCTTVDYVRADKNTNKVAFDGDFPCVYCSLELAISYMMPNENIYAIVTKYDDEHRNGNAIAHVFNTEKNKIDEIASFKVSEDEWYKTIQNKFYSSFGEKQKVYVVNGYYDMNIGKEEEIIHEIYSNEELAKRRCKELIAIWKLTTGFNYNASNSDTWDETEYTLFALSDSEWNVCIGYCQDYVNFK